MTNNDTVVYSINVEDLQTVAKRELARKLTTEEIELVGDKVGDFIDWREAIASAIELALSDK